MDTPTTLGVGIVLASNTVISLALNIQKLSHRRLGTERSSPAATPAATPGTGNGATKPRFKPSTAVILEAEVDERDPLLASRPPLRTSISSPRAVHAAAILPRRSSSLTAGRGSRLVPKPRLAPGSPASAADQVEVPAVLTLSLVPESSAQSTTSAAEEEDGPKPPEPPREADYLRSKLWWLGFVLMNVGEFGNFLSYAYAPASVIAPLGASALIANCFFSPLILHEKFRKRDILGIALTVLGALTLVSAAKSSDPRLDPEGLLAAITQRVFVIYAAINFTVAALLVWLSERPAGDKFIAIDIGICALFGGFTVLSTKGISTLVSMYGFGIFAIWLTYPLLLVLLVTGIGQIRYLNRALMRFDSKAVIPSQFVGFNLAVITGSAILFRDFDNVTFSRFLSFLNGCAMTFLGVWVLATKTNVASGEVQDDGEASTEVGPDHTESPVDLEHGPRRDPSIPRAISVPVVLRKKASAPALGLSPGQHLLIATDWEAASASTGAGGSLRGRERGRESRDGSVSARRRTIAFG